MTFEIDEAFEILARTPDVLGALLQDLSEPWLRAREADDAWGPVGVVAHLVHAERTDWIPRMRIILQDGEARTMEPVDWFAHIEEGVDRPLPDLLHEFRSLRESNLAALLEARAGGLDLNARGRHPELGSITLGQLLATWVVHDLSHIGRIVRALGARYAEDVGPFRAYLPMLQRRPRQ